MLLCSSRDFYLPISIYLAVCIYSYTNKVTVNLQLYVMAQLSTSSVNWVGNFQQNNSFNFLPEYREN